MMKPLIALSDFKIILPSILMNQNESLDYLTQVHSQVLDVRGESFEKIAKYVKHYGIKAKQIGQRRFENIQIAEDKKDILERMQFFDMKAREIVAKFYPKSSNAPNHIIHATCTGYISPSAVQILVSENNWNQLSQVTHAYHMGCYASLPAVRMAGGFIAAGDSDVDIVHTEMCGLHMDTNDNSPEQLIVQSLFADGHIKYSAKKNGVAKEGFRVLQIREFIVPDSENDMSWIPASWGMKMTLSREVPVKIKTCLHSFLRDLISKSPYQLADIIKHSIFAIHPGGPKIIDSIQDTLGLADAQLRISREVLFENGNMSSATLPFVWQKLLEQNIESKQLVVSLAFGPGLTIFGALFETI